MSDVNLDFTVSNNSIEFTVAPNDITITPSDIQLTFYNAAPLVAGGNVGELQYNAGGQLGGISSANYDAGNLTFQLANTKITGGDNHYYLQTDGTGNLTWAVGTGNMQGNGTVAGANTQIQFNDGGANFGGNAGFTFERVSGNVDIPGNLIIVGSIFGNVANANYAAYAGNVVIAAQPNITSLGTLISLSVNSDNIALGALTNTAGQGVSIGYGAGATNPGDDAVAIGDGTGGINQGTSATAIGPGAGRDHQGNYSTALGLRAGYYYQGSNSVAIGTGAGNTSQATNSIIINATGSDLNQTTANTFTVKPVRNVNTPNVMFYNNSTGEISYDLISNVNVANSNYANFAGQVINSSQPNITSLGTLTNLNVTGNITASNLQGSFANGTSNINIPTINGNIRMGVSGTANALVVSSSNTTASQFVATVATGTAPFIVTSTTLVPNLRVANATFANSAGTVTTNAQPNITSIGNLTNLTLTSNAVILGNLATGSNANYTVSIGANAGPGGLRSIALGLDSGGNTASDTISIGYRAGATGQKNNGIAIGYEAGQTNQGEDGISIGIGSGANAQRNFAIAIGTNAGNDQQGNYSIAIGAQTATTSQPNNSIALNATGLTLTPTVANAFYVKPIRDVTGNAAFTVQLYYNPTTGEIGYK